MEHMDRSPAVTLTFHLTLRLLHLVVNISSIIELSLNTLISTIPEDLGNYYNAYQLRERIKQHAEPNGGSSGEPIDSP